MYRKYIKTTYGASSEFCELGSEYRGPVDYCGSFCLSNTLPLTLSSEDRIRSPLRDFHILFVPRRSLLCEQRLKDQGVLGSFIHREEYNLDLIPFDGDLLSMESESAFKVSASFFVGVGHT